MGEYRVVKKGPPPFKARARPVGEWGAGQGLRRCGKILTHAPRQTACLFDHLVGGGEEDPWHVKAERFGGLNIDD